MICPFCEAPHEKIVAVEYAHDDPLHYDGISEFNCLDCRIRWGRWSKKILIGSEGEPPFGQTARKSKQ